MKAHLQMVRYAFQHRTGTLKAGWEILKALYIFHRRQLPPGAQLKVILQIQGRCCKQNGRIKIRKNLKEKELCFRSEYEQNRKLQSKDAADSDMLYGKAFKFGDDISTDLIAPGRYFHLRSNLGELAKHVLEDADPEFAKKVSKGDFVVGGRNFGLGSSREHAPTIIKLAGVGAVLAKSFARIFFQKQHKYRPADTYMRH